MCVREELGERKEELDEFWKQKGVGLIREGGPIPCAVWPS